VNEITEMMAEKDTMQKKPSRVPKKLIPGAPVLGQAFLAINRPSFGRLEWYFAFLSTI
jgi:hypothetical protein